MPHGGVTLTTMNVDLCVGDISVHRDGRLGAYITITKMLALWSPDPDMHVLLRSQPPARRGIAISADGKVLAESGDDSVLLYRLP
jgi:hypothetical protein